MKLQDQRRRKLVIVVHCILNQNSRVSGLAYYPAMIDEIVEVLKRHDVSFLQIPCPELIYAGVQRPRQTKEEYDTPRYRKHCRQIAVSMCSQLEELTRNGTRIIALLGVKGSPSCGVGKLSGETGILIEELARELERRELKTLMRALDFYRISADVKWLEGIMEIV